MSKGHRARKRFGQNFLVDTSVIERIVNAIDARPDQHVVEIGPGTGAITRPLLASGARLTVIEIDRDLVARLVAEPRLAGARIIQADALDVDYTELAAGQPLRLVGNLPYNISTPLLFKVLEHADCIADAHFMLQAEVVDRMQAAAGNRSYGRLSVMLQYYCQVEALFRIQAGAFRPAPRVESALARLTPLAKPERLAHDIKALQRVVRTAFGQRRKQLGNALRGLVSSETMLELGIEPTRRPETLTPQDFVALANASAGE